MQYVLVAIFARREGGDTPERARKKNITREGRGQPELSYALEAR